jgi:hypothetical protein
LHSFNLTSQHWINLSQRVNGDPPPSSKGHRIAVVRKSIFVFGGYSESGSYPRNIGSLSLFPAMYREISVGNVDTLREMKILIQKTVSPAGFLDTLYELDTSTFKWSDLTDIGEGSRPSPRGYHGFNPIGSKIYTFGGRSTLGKILYSKKIHGFSPRQDYCFLKPQ